MLFNVKVQWLCKVYENGYYNSPLHLFINISDYTCFYMRHMLRSPIWSDIKFLFQLKPSPSQYLPYRNVYYTFKTGIV